MVWGSKSIKEPKRLITTRIGIHDKTQIETIFNYRILFGTKKAVEPQRISYRLEAYLFMPNAFGLNPSVYQKENFYADMRPAIRFIEPKMGFQQLVGLKASASSPLNILHEIIARAPAEVHHAEINAACDEARLFGCMFTNYLGRKVGNFVRDLQKLESDRQRGEYEHAHLEALIEKGKRLHRNIETVAADWASLKVRLTRQTDERYEQLKIEISRSDELINYKQHELLAHLFDEIQRSDLAPLCDSLLALLNDYNKGVRAYAKKNGYFLIEGDSDERYREAFMARLQFLKLHVSEILHLEMRKKPLFRVQRQIGAMIAAGAAALWAVVAQIFVMTELIAQNQMIDIFGVGGFLFLSAGVLAYIVKDRIKEMGRSYFRGGLFGNLPDTSEELTYASGRANTQSLSVGNYQESVFIKNEKDLPDEVQKLREAQLRGNSSEQVVQKVIGYRRDVQIYKRMVQINGHPLKIVHDIMRYDISGFLGRLGNPTVDARCLDEHGILQHVELPKIYHMDLIVRYQKLSSGSGRKQESLEYIRFYVDKDGLKRMEKLS